ncbi:hypothetical protein MVEG_11748 [Podila verticillata NRRL 6337]|uniref:Uncharacterized protein n=1 Tax=Podila verticillata NRRL 6337 TaxID=1069443 RepID=A0A086TJI2_9FUNG|nr:hypothetical protein MVEG_11748 [Podila verticillata NRRL 6337]
MASLVALKPGCYATDGTSIYALDLRVPQKTSFFGYSDFYYVLVKSNPNPSPDLSDISWSVVSVTNGDGLNILGSPSVCYIHPTTKAFSVLSLWSKVTKGFESLKESVRGVQYQPKADGGGGIWANITVSPGSPLFEWDSSIASQYSNTELYKPKDSDSIMFATANPHVENPNSAKSDTKLWIASMDPSDLIMKQKPSPWLYDPALYGDLIYITFADNALYFYARTFSNFTLGAVPISGDTLASSPSVVSTFDTKNYQKICGTFSTDMTITPLGANIVLQCRGGPVFLFDGKNISNVSTSTEISKQSFLSPILTMPGTVPFLFSAATDSLYSLPISGPNTGKWFNTKMITIPASALENLTPSGPGAGSSSSSKSGVIIGVVCAVLVLVIGGIGYFWYRKRSAQIKTG